MIAFVGVFIGAGGFNTHLSPIKNSIWEDNLFLSIPLPIQVVIDDVCWWSGRDGSKYQEPYRSGINRNHVPADYTAIVELGKALNIRPQAAIVLCEWDKENILRQLPSATWMGKNWDNSKWVGPWMEEAADIISKNKRHIELTLHGIGHEYWINGEFSRAEWADVNGSMRPREQVKKHLHFFEKIMQQHRLGPFPTSFVPTAFFHGFGITPGHDVSIAEILSLRGIKYINTPFHQMYNAGAVEFNYSGYDSGVFTIDRGKDLLEWNVIGEPPVGELKGPTCGMHWANLIHPDPDRNMEIVEEWARFLSPYNEKEDTMLAPDSSAFQSQLLYHECTKISKKRNRILFDFAELKSLPGNNVKNGFALKIRGEKELRFESNDIIIESQSLKRTGKDCLHTLKLKRKHAGNNASLNFFK